MKDGVSSVLLMAAAVYARCVYFQDFNECADDSTNDCDQGSCVNTAGDYSCDCNAGYTGRLCETGASLFAPLFKEFNQIKMSIIFGKLGFEAESLSDPYSCKHPATTFE